MTEEKIEFCGKVRSFFHVSETASTNDLAKAYAKTHDTDAVFLADSQTNGRGRGEHTFLSPAGGLYVSYLFHPRGRADTMHLTAAAAVAVCRALETCAGVPCAIKWVNDVYVGGKKIAGILAEGETEGETYRYAVLGVGVNIRDVIEDKDVQKIATSVEEEGGTIPTRKALAERILSYFEEALANDAETMEKYREKCFVLGGNVCVIDGEKTYEAHVSDMDNDGALLLTLPSGERRILRAGEIHIKPIM